MLFLDGRETMNTELIRQLKHRSELPFACRLSHVSAIAEVGVNRGIYLKWLATAEPAILVGVDTWHGQFEQPSEDHYQELLNWSEQFDFEIHLLKMPSHEAAGRYRLGDFDVVFIDAAHDFVSCSSDMRIWWPLVKRDGLMLVHNGLCPKDRKQQRQGVIQAIARFSKENPTVQIIEGLECSTTLIFRDN